MFKVICKTALKTLLIVAVVALVAFGVASLAFPSDMAGMCERTGNYSMATGYASLSYTYSGNVNDLNRCFLDSVYAKKDSDVVRFGDKLIADEKFPEVCEKSKTATAVGADYKQYVYGHVAVAKYRRGNADEAFDTAASAMDGVSGFPKNNALSMLSLQVIESGDKDTAAKLLTKLQEFSPSEGDAEYYNAVVGALQKF